MVRFLEIIKRLWIFMWMQMRQRHVAFLYDKVHMELAVEKLWTID